MRYLKALLRGSMHTIVYTVVMLVVMLYLVVHLNIAGRMVKHGVDVELSELLGTRVTLEGGAEVDWRNQVVLNQLTIYDQQDDTLLYARRAMVGYEVLPLLLRHKLVLTTAQLIDFALHVRRPSGQAPSNYAFIIDKLQPRSSGADDPAITSIDLGAVLLRRGTLTYDVDDMPHQTRWPLDPNHLHISQLRANLTLHDQQLHLKNLNGQTSRLQFRSRHARADLSQGTATLQEVTLHGDVTASLDATVSPDTLTVHLHQLHYPALHDLQARATLHLGQLSVASDSLHYELEELEASCCVPQLGTVTLNGHAQGQPVQSLIDLRMTLPSGALQTHGTLLWHRPEQQIAFDGECDSRHGLNLAQLLEALKVDNTYPQLGTVAFSSLLHASYDILHTKPHLDMRQAHFTRLEMAGHTYRDVAVNLRYETQHIEGDLQVADSLADLDAHLHIEQQRDAQPRYQLKAQVRHLQPYAMGLTSWEPLDSITLSGHVNIDMIGQKLGELQGIVQLTDLWMARQHDTLHLEPLLMEGTPNQGRLTSPFLYADYNRRHRQSVIDLNGYVPVMNEALQMLRLPYQMSNVVRIMARVDTTGHLRNGELDIPRLRLNEDTYLTAHLKSGSAGDTLLPQATLHYETPQHQLKTALQGRIALEPTLDVRVSPATILYNKEELSLSGAHLRRNVLGDYQLEGCSIRLDDQHIAASGLYAHDGNHDLSLQLQHFDLGHIFGLLAKRYTHFGGFATGSMHLGSTPHSHFRTDSLYIQDITYIDTLLGNAYLTLNMDMEPQTHITLSADINTPSRRWPTLDMPDDHTWHTHIDGDVRLNKHDTIDIHFMPDHLPLGFINYWVGNILHDFYGWTSGDLRLFGDTRELNLEGHPLVDGLFTHPLLGAHFHFQDTLRMDPGHIHFDDMRVDDRQHHTLQLDANVLHNHLHDFHYDVDIHMPENGQQGFLAFDRPRRRPGDTWWGQLYTQGRCTLRGGGGAHRFSLNFRTAAGSWFYLSPHEQNLEGETAYSMLTFRDKATLADALQQEIRQKQETDTPHDNADETRSDMQVDMQIAATEQCQVTVQMDPLASNDLLVCRGNGDLALHYDTRHDISLAGTYHITSGTYSMNMRADLMNKVFQLQNTSYVSFSGVPSEAELSLDARYNIPSVNLTDLDQNITTLGGMGRTTVPVDCKLQVSGLLNAPQVDFDLDVRNVNEEIQAYVHNIIATPEMRNQEVLYLLLFSKFYTPQYAQASATQNRGSSELTSFASASITSQLNQMMGRLSNNFTMGTNVRTDKGDFTDMEMDLSLSTRLLGDRLQLSGNFGYRDPASRIGTATNSSNFIGDFDLEFLVNTRGTVRLKAYSHYNQRDYTINNALTTQGIGIVLHKDFKTLRQLFGGN